MIEADDAPPLLDVGGTPVHAVRWEPRGNGQTPSRVNAPVFLLHGLGGSTLNWSLVGPRLAEVLHTQVTAIDLLGFGRTPLGNKQSTIDSNVELAAAFVRASQPAILMGTSMGGSIGVRMAARYPELVEALVLVNPALPFARGIPSRRHVLSLAAFATASLPKAGPWLIDARAKRLGAARVVDASLRAACLDVDVIDRDVRDALIELNDWQQQQGEASLAYHESIRSLLPYLMTTMDDDLGAVEAPVLVVHGREDRLVPLVLVESASRRRPDWSFELLNCGHIPPLEMPEHLVEVVSKWLGNVPVPSSR
jgi:pimeloyl-ACP methyl ester carboxylesterase